VTFLNVPAKNKKLVKKWLEQLRRDERFMPKKTSKMCMCATSISQTTVSKLNTDLRLWWKHKKEVIEEKCFPTIFQGKTLVWPAIKPGTWNILEHPGTFRNIQAA